MRDKLLDNQRLAVQVMRAWGIAVLWRTYRLSLLCEWTEVCMSSPNGLANIAWTVGANLLRGEYMLDVRPETNETMTTIAWLADALEHARGQGQTKLEGYLEAIVADVVFEAEYDCRHA